LGKHYLKENPLINSGLKISIAKFDNILDERNHLLLRDNKVVAIILAFTKIM